MGATQIPFGIEQNRALELTVERFSHFRGSGFARKPLEQIAGGFERFEKPAMRPSASSSSSMKAQSLASMISWF
jgi:hypothetical protein